MKNRILFGSIFLALMTLSIQGISEAARKYYPPGFTPPTDQSLVPTTPAPSSPKPTTPVVILQSPPTTSKQVIIKTVPRFERPKPVDPLVVLMNEHRYFDALRLVDKRLKASPNNLSLMLMRGRILREEGSYDQSIAQFQSILGTSHHKDSLANALNGMGWTYYEQALHDKQMGNQSTFSANLRAAQTYFLQAHALLSDFAYPDVGLAEVALASGQPRNAKPWIDRAKTLSPDALPVQLVQAEQLLAENKPEEALQFLYGIKKTTTHDPEVYLLLARASYRTDRIDDAIINLKQLLSMSPDQTEALQLLSQSYEKKMKPEDAEVTLEKEVALNPSDLQSVDALLKIYDERKETDRSVLLLKTLLKDRPEQVGCALPLLTHLSQAGQWEETYQEGLKIIPYFLKNISGSTPANTDTTTFGLIHSDCDKVLSIFAMSVYQKGRGLLDTRVLLNQPVVQQTQTFLQNRLAKADTDPNNRSQALNDRLDLLLLNPLRRLPALPANLKLTDGGIQALLLQIAFLQGDGNMRSQMLTSIQQWPEQKSQFDFARHLYELGDYTDALTLVNHVQLMANLLSAESKQATQAGVKPDNKPEINTSELNTLKQSITNRQKALAAEIEAFSMLPNKVPEGYWQKTSEDVLWMGGNTNSKAQALLAQGLIKRHALFLAARHESLAMQYAETPKERERLQKRADHLNRLLQ